MKNILNIFAFTFLSFFAFQLNAQDGNYNEYPNYDHDHSHDQNHNHDHYEEEDSYYNRNKRAREQRKAQRRNNRHSNNSHGHGHDSYNNEFTIYDQAAYWHLVPLGYNTFQVSYEQRQQALDGGIRGWLFSAGLTLSNKIQNEQKGFMGEVQYRYYFKRVAPNFEMYGAPYAQFRKLSIERGDTYDDNGQYIRTLDDISSFSGGILFGLHFFLFDQLILELQGGGGFMNSKVPEEARFRYGDNPWEVGYTGISVKGGINIGFAF